MDSSLQTGFGFANNSLFDQIEPPMQITSHLIVLRVAHQVLPPVQAMILQLQISSQLMLIPVYHQVRLILVKDLVISFQVHHYLVMEMKTKMITGNVKMKPSHKQDDQYNYRT